METDKIGLLLNRTNLSPGHELALLEKLLGHHSNLEKENIESKSKVDGSQFTLLELKLLYLSEISFDIYYKLAGRARLLV